MRYDLHQSESGFFRSLGWLQLATFLVTWTTGANAAQAAIEQDPVSEASQFDTNLDFVHTSDAIEQTDLRLSYRNHRRDSFWPYPGERNEAYDLGVQGDLFTGKNPSTPYRAARWSALMARKFSPTFLLEASLGTDTLKAEADSLSHTTLVAGARGKWTAFDQLNVSVGFNHDYVYSDLMQPGGVTAGVTATRGDLELNYRPFESLRATFHPSYGSMSDGNSRQDYDLSASYGISTGTPWIWAGIGAESLSFSRSGVGYWSPSRFFAVGPRFEAVVPLYQAFSGSVGLNLNRFQEEGFSPGFGYYGNIKLNYGTREGRTASLAYTRIQAAQSAGLWYSNGATFSVSSPF